MDVNHKSIRCDTWIMLFSVCSSCVPVHPPSDNPTHSAGGIPEDIQSSNFVVLESLTQMLTTRLDGSSSSTTRNSLTSLVPITHVV